jgi:hypothetical protein
VNWDGSPGIYNIWITTFRKKKSGKSLKRLPKKNLQGFIGLFFSACWDIIKEDVLRAISQFYALNQQGLQFLNQALVVLIPKKSNPISISDYRPISLTHNFSKIISKLLANRLAPELDQLVSVN